MNESGEGTTVQPINDIAKALAQAQMEMPNPAFDSSVKYGTTNFRFASLASVRNTVVPILAKHGISLQQDILTTERGVACLTILTHSSGQQMRFGPLEMPASKGDAQGFGSAATYARRYSMMAVCGVVGDEDDDGNQAVASQGREVSNKVVAANVKPTAGALESLPIAMQKQVTEWATQIDGTFNNEGPKTAYALYCSIRDGKLEGETEAKVALRGLLDSKIRSQFQKYASEQVPS